jgi:predicted DNA-binding protein
MGTTMSKKTNEKDRHLPHRLVRIPEELYQRLQELAERTDRPVSREVRRALEAHLKAHEESEAGG